MKCKMQSKWEVMAWRIAFALLLLSLLVIPIWYRLHCLEERDRKHREAFNKIEEMRQNILGPDYVPCRYDR